MLMPWTALPNLCVAAVFETDSSARARRSCTPPPNCVFTVHCARQTRPYTVQYLTDRGARTLTQRAHGESEKMDGVGSFGAGRAGAAFDPLAFAKQPQTILRVLSWVRLGLPGLLRWPAAGTVSDVKITANRL